MAYITQTDIESLVGVTNVAVWSNLDNDDTSADTSRIDAAIEYGEDYVESRMRQKFAIPLTALSGSFPASLKDLIVKMAAWWLYSSRGIKGGGSDEAGDRISAWRKEVEEILDYHNARTRDWNLRRATSRDVRAPGVA